MPRQPGSEIPTPQPRSEPSFPFLRLPRELRDHIYKEHILDSPPYSRWLYCRTACTICTVHEQDRVPDPACRRHGLLLVNRQVSSEYLDLVAKRITKHIFHIDGLCRDSRLWVPQSLKGWVHDSLKPNIRRMQLIFNWDADFNDIRTSSYQKQMKWLNNRHEVIDFALTFPLLVELEVEYRISAFGGLDIVCAGMYGLPVVDEFVHPFLQKMLPVETLRRVKFKWASSGRGEYEFIRGDSENWMLC
jgi:hypothetical protein